MYQRGIGEPVRSTWQPARPSRGIDEKPSEPRPTGLGLGFIFPDVSEIWIDDHDRLTEMRDNLSRFNSTLLSRVAVSRYRLFLYSG